MDSTVIPSGARLLTTAETCQRIGYGKSWLFARRKSDPTFPRPVYASALEPRFIDSEVDAWIAKLASMREAA